MAFRKATKKQTKLRLAIAGPSGTGKTRSSLIIAKVLGAKTALIDGERGSASKYSHVFDFDEELPTEHSLENYIRMINEAAAGGYGTLIIDTLSHCWAGKGGALETVDRLGGIGGNEFTDGWGEVTPVYNRLIDTLAGFPGHLICTFRMKVKRVLEPNKKGKMVPRVVGTVPVFREGIEHEFDVFTELDAKRMFTFVKDRSENFQVGDRLPRTELEVTQLATKVLAWLNQGIAAPPPAPARLPATAPKEDDGFNTAPAAAPAAAPAPAPADQVAAAVARLDALLPSAKSTADMDRIAELARKEPEEVKRAFRSHFQKRLSEVAGGSNAAVG